MPEYWVVRGDNGSGRSRKLHSREDCISLRQAKTYGPAVDVELERFEECKTCRGERVEKDDDWGYYRSLQEAAQDA